MIKRIFFVLSLIFILSIGSAVYGSENITVEVPRFEVTINNQVFDNTSAKYPLLTYRDITYFPMTYTLCEHLGVTTGWLQESGLSIIKYSISDAGISLEAELGGSNSPGRTYTATIPTYPISVNNVKINNATEQYPIFNYNNITYFPLTWEYGNDEFGWDVIWNDETGLSVNSFVQNSRDDLVVVEINDTDALLQRNKSESEEIQLADGSFTLKDTDEYTRYILDYAQNKLIYEEDVDKFFDPWQTFESANDDLEVEDGKILYKDIVLEDGLNTGAYDKALTSISGSLVETEDATFVRIPFYLDADFISPYSDTEIYVYMIDGDEAVKIESWDTNAQFHKVVETKDAYYLGSYASNIAGSSRYSIGLSTTVKVDKETGKETMLNDLWDDYFSVKLIGARGDDVYIECKYFSKEAMQNMYSNGKISVFNDGYFLLDNSLNLTKVHGILEGEAFVGGNGKLYHIAENQFRITNLTDGIRIMEQ